MCKIIYILLSVLFSSHIRKHNSNVSHSFSIFVEKNGFSISQMTTYSQEIESGFLESVGDMTYHRFS